MFALEFLLPEGDAVRLLRHRAVTAAKSGRATSRAHGAGRATIVSLIVSPIDSLGAEPAPVTLTILRGAPDAADGARPGCRVILAGPEAATVALARTLAESFPLIIPHVGANAALATEDKPLARRLGTIALPRGLTVGAGFARIVAHLSDVLLYWAAHIPPAGADLEPVHQLRVALRRLRSALSVFRHAIACPATEAVSNELRALGRVLGPARDWDVFLGGTGRDIGAAFPTEKSIARLLHAATQQRDAAYAELAATLNTPKLRGLGIALAALAGGSAWQDGLDDAQRSALQAPLEDFAAEILARRHKRVARAGADFSKLDAPALHALRLAGKRLRYAAEFFSSLFDAKPAQRLVRRLTALQESLGGLNDATVAATLMAELGPPGFAAGAVLGFTAAEARDTRRKLSRRWKKLRRLESFWG